MPRVLVSLGSNLGDSAATFDAAEAGLRRLALSGSLRVSDRIVTEAVGGPGEQSPFLNAAAVFECSRKPAVLLAELQAIEATHQRVRHERWSARTLDIDLLLYGDRVVRRAALRVPHPRMTYRPFVLAPAAELVPDWTHPECGETLAQILERLRTGRDAVRLVGDSDGKVRGWIEAALGSALPVESSHETSPEPPRLTIDARRLLAVGPREGPNAAPTPGPRLALADCPAEHWRDEVLAALDCVWPSGPR